MDGPRLLPRTALLLALGLLLTGSGGHDRQWAPGFVAAQAADAGPATPAGGTCKAHKYDTGPYRMLTDAHTRQMGQSYLGDRSRLLAALQRYRDGANLTIGVVGGSISAGQGASDAPSYPYWTRIILQALLPGGKERVNVVNGAMSGTTSQYMSTCVNLHVPATVDIVIVEYAINDEEMPMPHMNNKVRRPYERLIRKLLNYPRRPAVILLHAYRWFGDAPPGEVRPSGQFWTSSERQHGEFGLYYGLPQLSVKSCCYHHMLKGVAPYNVSRVRHGPNFMLHEPAIDATLRGSVFYYDTHHPDGNTGHRVMGELAAQFVMDAWAQVASGHSLSEEDVRRVNAPLSQPLLPHNMESNSTLCFIGRALVTTAVRTSGFKWVNEGKTPDMPKWGFVSTKPGSELRISVSTRTRHEAKKDSAIVELGYLRSYDNVGRFKVKCVEGCACEDTTLDGLHDQKNSQTFLHSLNVSQADRCVISITVLPDSSTGKHKVKITGVMVSEDPEAERFQNVAAWEVVARDTSLNPLGVAASGERRDDPGAEGAEVIAGRRVLREAGALGAGARWFKELQGEAELYSFLHA
ncbi:hypothetical protein HYH03_008215 [Edaphochlamys debaryana]|uniref:SGNH hydrolase-type esterase domain-containing protein n=1 Tax=Edaphochlamys debaryana TaxID=47281 RepID=A0A835Y3Z8_9CHLO|nr:hypothetical protein HYH03_008215 [Edaphochlamys debaryana]|eukprot:KAG2493701.1 hypothetical protein HYH03_008215 [Edaphochlamys debaryana]